MPNGDCRSPRRTTVPRRITLNPKARRHWSGSGWRASVRWISTCLRIRASPASSGMLTHGLRPAPERRAMRARESGCSSALRFWLAEEPNTASGVLSNVAWSLAFLALRATLAAL
eukprot:scaffold43913_cov33-Tisochrysis_lutea.AAC.2